MNTEQEKKEQFKSAMIAWEESSNRAPILELLKPFADYFWLDIEESMQGGSDCGAIEILGEWAAPLMQSDSGDAIMLIIEQLSDAYKDIQFALKEGEWVVGCFHCKHGNYEPSATNACLLSALLEIIVVTPWEAFPEIVLTFEEGDNS